MVDSKDLLLEIKKKEEEIKMLKQELNKTSKIRDYYNKEVRKIRREDINDEEIKKWYSEGMSAYRISMLLTERNGVKVGVMTIIYRLKRMGIYKGKE